MGSHASGQEECRVCCISHCGPGTILGTMSIVCRVQQIQHGNIRMFCCMPRPTFCCMPSPFPRMALRVYAVNECNSTLLARRTSRQAVCCLLSTQTACSFQFSCNAPGPVCCCILPTMLQTAATAASSDHAYHTRSSTLSVSAGMHQHVRPWV